MDTLPMNEEWWDDDVNEDGSDSALPPSVEGSKDDGEVPPTQPDPEETKMEEEDEYMVGGKVRLRLQKVTAKRRR